MADLFGQALWDGAESYLDCSYTCSWGVTPGTATLTIPPQLAEVAEVGDLTLTDGQNSITLKGCKVVKPSGQVTGQGQSVTLLIEDRRWKWRFGAISGRYNVPAERTATVPALPQPGQPPGNQPAPPRPPPPGEEPVQPWTKKTARELAELCLKAMGETRYDVSALDPKATPSAEWDAANPALSLQQLAESLGCVVVYRPDSDSVLIAKRGEGKELPGGAFLADTESLEVAARPKKITLFGAPVRFQRRFALEAVGMDFDGSIRPIGSLSYRPSGGWTAAAPPNFANLPTTGLPGGRTQQDAQALAAQWVYRAYRIKPTGADGKGKLFIPPNDPRKVEVKRIQQVRLLPVKNVTAKDDLGREALAPAACYGRHNPPLAVKIGQTWVGAYEQTAVDTEVRCPLSVDDQHQTIVFARYLFALKSDGKVYPAEIVLECACEVQDPDTNQYIRFVRDLELPGGLDTKPAVLIRDDVRYMVTSEYAAGTNHKRNTGNEAEAGRRADYFLRGEARRYEPQAAGDRVYPGVQPIYPDGAIQQVSWSVGGGSPQNPQTRASRNTEHATYLPAYEARRRIEETTLDQRRQDVALRRPASQLREAFRRAEAGGRV